MRYKILVVALQMITVVLRSDEVYVYIQASPMVHHAGGMDVKALSIRQGLK